jgi:hypothetical protein
VPAARRGPACGRDDDKFPLESPATEISGETVLDLGSGGGIDVLLSARLSQVGLKRAIRGAAWEGSVLRIDLGPVALRLEREPD